jgi:hypothetical protein
MHMFRIQRPTTFHCVFTLDHTITQGHHFYMVKNIRASTHQVAHSFVGRYTVTNKLHYYTTSLLRRLLCASVAFFVGGQYKSGKWSRTPQIIISPTLY